MYVYIQLYSCYLSRRVDIYVLYGYLTRKLRVIVSNTLIKSGRGAVRITMLMLIYELGF